MGGTIQLDKNLFPVDSPITQGVLPPKVVAWRDGANQQIQTRKIRASSGQFERISGTISGNQLIDSGTISASLVKNGTAANNIISGGTINTSIWQGGTINGNISDGGTWTGGTHNNGIFGTPSVTGGTINSPLISGGTANNQTLGTPSITGGTNINQTINNATIGTPTITGGTCNAGTYQVGGSAGLSGSIIYIKTISPGTTFGTLSFLGGLITAST